MQINVQIKFHETFFTFRRRDPDVQAKTQTKLATGLLANSLGSPDPHPNVRF
jgi:hypothetical protein